MSEINILTIFLTGLTTGGLTCLAIQGGLLTSVIAQSPNHKATSIISFLSGKLFIHTILGFLLGALGQTLTLSPIARGWIQIIIGIYLLGIAGNLLDLHPLFRYFVIKPPKFLAKIARNESRSKSIFAPFLLGLTTVFLPCAVTQATEVIAIGTGNSLYGAAIMFSFILGTIPSFLFFGFLLNSSAGLFKKLFPKIAFIALVFMSIYSINNGVGLTGSVYTLQNFYQVAVHPDVIKSAANKEIVINNGIQTTTISVTNEGYAPQVITLKKDVPVRLTLSTRNVQNCSRSFSIPALNIVRLLPETGDVIVEFTPHDLGPLAFSCSMGMYTGRFNVVN